MEFDMEAGNELVNQIRTSIQKLAQYVREMEKWTTRVDLSDGESKDREHFNQLAQNANALARDVNKSMQKLVAYSNNDRQMKVHRQRLSDEFIQVLNRLQEAQRNAERAEKEGMKQARYSAQQDEEEAHQREMAASYDAERRKQIQEQQRVNINNLKERQQSLQELERDIQDVHSIFADLARIVHDQGEMVDSIEDHVEGANLHVQAGNEQIRQAVVYRDKARQKKIMLFIFLLVLIGIIVLTVYFGMK